MYRKNPIWVLGMSYEDFITTVETYLEKSGMSPSTFGHRALNDPGFIAGLKDGREPRRATRQKVVDFIAAEQAAA